MKYFHLQAEIWLVKITEFEFCIVILLTSNHVIRDSFLSRLPIIFLELGDPENAQGIPALMMLFRDRSTMRMGDVRALRKCVRHNIGKKVRKAVKSRRFTMASN